MNEPMQLSLEQQFSLRSFEAQVEQMSPDQAKQFLVKLYEQTLIKDAMYREMFKHHLGIGPNPVL